MTSTRILLLGKLIVGFTVYYRSTKPIDPHRHQMLDAASDDLCRGRSWLSSEPVSFFGGDDDGHVWGGSKPNFSPHREDVAEAESKGLPDGTIQDAIEILCQLSRDHNVDWEISHDESDGPVGFIRKGRPDTQVTEQIDTIMRW